MKKINLFMLIIFAIFTSRFFEQNIFAQIETQNIQGKEYKIIEGKWYSYFEGKKGDEIVPTRLIVRLKDKGYLENFNFKNLNLNGVSIGSNRFLNGYYVLTIDSTINQFETAKILEASNLFDVVEFDAIGKFLVLIPKDPFFDLQWNLMKINITNAWHITTGNSSIILGMIDSGVKYRHPDIDNNIWVNSEEDINENGKFDFMPVSSGGDLDGLDNDNNGFVDDLIGWDFFGDNPNIIQPDNDPDESFGHGTGVAGVMSAQTNNLESGSYIGISGVAGGWGNMKGCRLMVLRVSTVGTTPEEIEEVLASQISQAIEYAARNGTRVINISIGFKDSHNTLLDAVNLAVNNFNVIIVAAAGNNGENIIHFC